MKYYINHGTGAGNMTVDGTLEQAKEIADEGACYTQVAISIEDEHGNEIARRPWWSVEYYPEVEDDDDVILFGTFGYFGGWIDLD